MATPPELVEADKVFVSHFLEASALAVYVGEPVEPELGLRPRVAARGLFSRSITAEANTKPLRFIEQAGDNSPRPLFQLLGAMEL